MPNTLYHLQIEIPFTIKQTIIGSMIESSDLWTKSTSAGGSLAWGESSVTLNSNTTLNGLASILKNTSIPPFDPYWNKKRTLRFTARFTHADDPNSLIYVGMGHIYTNEYGFGIKAERNRIIGVSANGGAPSILELITGLTPPWNESHLYEMTFIPAQEIEFFVDGVSKGKITTNLPAGAGSAYIPFKAYVKTGTSGVGHSILTSGFMAVVDT